MRLTVRREQMEVMSAVAEANFERRIAEHLRQSYPSSVVKLSDGGEFEVFQLMEDSLLRLVHAGVSKARRYELTQESSIAVFVTLMFDVAPNFDEHRLCTVLLGDEEKPPDLRIDDVLSILTEKNFEAIRKDYDPSGWDVPEDQASTAESDEAAASRARAAAADPMMRTTPGKTLTRKTLRGKTLSGKTQSGTLSPKSQTIKVQPQVPDSDDSFDQNTVKIDRED